MTEQDLLKRIEEQAAEIGRLRLQLAEAARVIGEIPAKIQQAERWQLENMAKAAYNCGKYSGCGLAQRNLG